MDAQQTSPFKSRSGLVRIARAFGYSMRGLRAAWRHEHAFRQEVALAAVLLPVSLIVPVPYLHKALLLGSVLLVLVVELLNSAVEAAVDRVSLDSNELAGRAKDIGSAAVFVSLVLCGAVWLLVLLDAYAH